MILTKCVTLISISDTFRRSEEVMMCEIEFEIVHHVTLNDD